MKNPKLVFEDHFDAPRLDRGVWKKELGLVRNNEPQYYTDEDRNCYTENSCLVIETIREEYRGAHYTSACVYTSLEKGWTYGRFEMRAKLPAGRSLWPAFWTLGADIDDVGWPRCGEIDIMEMTGGAGLRDNKVIATLHWQSAITGEHDESGGANCAYVNDRPLSEDFHVYAVEWTADKLIWFFDGSSIHECGITPDMQNAFNGPHYMILNTALENWDENTRPDDTTPLPQKYVIDYVRVYQEQHDTDALPGNI